MTIQLYTAEINPGNESCVEIPGFSHWGQPRRKYPTAINNTEMVRTIYFFAKSRTHAGKCLTTYCGITTPCNLSYGVKSPLLTESIIKRVEKS